MYNYPGRANQNRQLLSLEYTHPFNPSLALAELYRSYIHLYPQHTMSLGIAPFAQSVLLNPYTAGIAAIGGVGWVILVGWGAIMTPAAAPVAMTTIKEVPRISDNLATICHIHFELFNAYPAQGADTFFQILDIDPAIPPFNTAAYLRPGEAGYYEARDIIAARWAERQRRLVDYSQRQEGSVLPNELQLLYRVAAALQERGTAATYMSVVMPAMASKKIPDQRVAALKGLCGNDWSE